MKPDNYIFKFNSLFAIYFSIALFFSLLFYTPSPFCKLKPLSDDELANVTAQGFASFSVTSNTTKVFIDIHVESLGTIDSFQGGYHNFDSSGTYGWDVDWSNIHLGQDTSNPLTFDGFIMQTEFDSVNNISSTDPELKRIIIGTNRVQGSVTADMNSFSGVYNPALTPDPSDGTSAIALDRAPLGNTTFNFDSSGDDMGFFIVFTLDGIQSGMQLVAGYNMSETPNSNHLDMSYTTSSWW